MKILDRIALLKIWLGNGQNYANDLKYPIALSVALKLYFPTTSFASSLFLVVGFIIFLIFVGWFDMKFIHLAQKVNEISTRKYNPYFAKLEQQRRHA